MINNKKIMVVEDEKLTMLFISETLEDYGYKNILGYASSEEILTEIKAQNIPDLILMDINIKGPRDGIQTATDILKLCTVPIVFMSAYNDKETIKEVLSVSLYGFLSKPFDERELYIAIEIAWKNFYQNINEEIPKISTTLKLYDNCIYDLKSENIYLDNKIIILPHNQHILLLHLAQNANTLVNKEQLSYHIWKTKIESASALRTVVYLLRKRLKGIEISSQSKHGYVLKATTI